MRFALITAAFLLFATFHGVCWRTEGPHPVRRAEEGVAEKRHTKVLQAGAEALPESGQADPEADSEVV